MEVRIKKLHPEAVIPSYAKAGDAGLDLVALGEPSVNYDTGVATYRTGLAMEIPEGYVGLIFPRSSASKVGARLANAVGVIDSGYRGEILLKFDVSPYTLAEIIEDGFSSVPRYRGGDKIAQLVIMPYPQVEFIETGNLSETSRGEGGFGSTGK